MISHLLHNFLGPVRFIVLHSDMNNSIPCHLPGDPKALLISMIRCHVLDLTEDKATESGPAVQGVVGIGNVHPAGGGSHHDRPIAVGGEHGGF